MSETIIAKDSSEQFKEDYTRYGVYIMFRRILTDFKDGLKPGQRYILYDMFKDRYFGHSKKVKSAAVVGDVLKNFHPHGDEAIYNTIKPMTNWFESYIPIIGNGGNFGTFQGSPAAASRYTEVYLTKFAEDIIFGDLLESREAVDWTDNYSRSCREPEYLPVKLPLLLIEGSFGIGIGIKAEIPSHNTNEVIDAVINLIRDPNAPVTLIPDHCMSCYIVDTDFEAISNAGFGNYKVRGIIEKEDYHGKTALVIKSVPNLTYLDTITDKIDDLVQKKKIIQIENCYDESTCGKNNKPDEMRYVIVLKPGSDADYVMNVIYKNTEMEQNCKVNFFTLDGLTPMRMSYKGYLQAFIEFRKLTKFRIYMNKLQDLQTRIHERDAYIAVLESGEIDTIVQMIRKRKDTNDDSLIEYLVTKLKITDLQARYIIDCNLKRLSMGYLEMYKNDRIKLLGETDYYQKKALDDNAIIEDIVKELLEIKAKYGSPRRCKVIRAAKAIDMVPAGEMKVVITEKNFIKKVPINLGIGVFKNDAVKRVIRVDNRDNILLFDDMGKVFKLPVNSIPFSDRISNGIDIRFLVKGLTANIASVISEDLIVRLDKDKRFLNFVVCVTKSGLLKKMDLGDFVNVPPSGVIYCKVDQGDSVINVITAASNLGIILYSHRKAVPVNVEHIAHLKKNTKGSRAFSTETGVDGICILNNTAQYIVVVTESGMINKFATFSSQNISKKGASVIKLNKMDSIKSIICVNDTDTMKITSVAGGVKEFKVAEIPIGSSIGPGIKMIPTKSDKILKVEVYH